MMAPQEHDAIVPDLYYSVDGFAFRGQYFFLIHLKWVLCYRHIANKISAQNALSKSVSLKITWNQLHQGRKSPAEWADKKIKMFRINIY